MHQSSLTKNAISALTCIVYMGVSTFVNADEVSSYIVAAGWKESGKAEVVTANGNKSAIVFSKKIGDSDAALTYLEDGKLLNCSSPISPTSKKVFIAFFGELHTIAWTGSSVLAVGGYSQKATTAGEAKIAIETFEKIYERNPKELQKQRTYKGALGIYGYSAPVLLSIAFKGENILLTFRNSSGDAVLELSPGFEYVRSVVKGKEVDSKTVKVLPMQALAERLHKVEQQAEEMKRKEADNR